MWYRTPRTRRRARSTCRPDGVGLFVFPSAANSATGQGPATQSVSSDHPHNSRSRAAVDVRPDQGTHTTRFQAGFARRQEPDICADAPRKAHEAMLMDRNARNEAGRRQRLGELGDYNRFNVISGDFDPGGIRKGMAGLQGTHSYDAGFVTATRPTGMHPQMHTVGGPDDPGESRYPELNGPTPVVSFRPYQGSRLNPAVARDGANLLAQSHYRFFAPTPTGGGQDARQVNLVHEGGGPSDPRAAGGGNGKERKIVSGVIGTFRVRDQLPSNGLEDQFSKSAYGKDAHELPGGGPFDDPAAAAATAAAAAAAEAAKRPKHPNDYFGLGETRRPGLYTPRKQAERLRLLWGGDDDMYRDHHQHQHQHQQQQQHHHQQQQQQREFGGGGAGRGGGGSCRRPGDGGLRSSARPVESARAASTREAASARSGYGGHGGGYSGGFSACDNAGYSARGGGGGGFSARGGSSGGSRCSARGDPQQAMAAVRGNAGTVALAPSARGSARGSGGGGGGGGGARESARDREIAAVRSLS